MKKDGKQHEKKEEQRKGVFNQEIDRRAFLQKTTTTLAGAAFGLALFNPFGSPVKADSSVNALIDFSSRKPSFQFGLIADIQYADVDSYGTRYYRASLGKLGEAVKAFNKQDLAFTIQLGDLIDRDASSFSKVLPIFNQINGPKYHMLGNHDYAMDAKKVANLLGMSNSYYDFSHEGWRFVVLDTNDLSTYANPAGSEKYQKAQKTYDVLAWTGADNAQTWNGGADSDQMAWLEDILSKSVNVGEKVVVLGHNPVAPLNMHNAWNDKALIKAFEASGNVVAYFNGHNHAGNYAEQSGIHYYNFKGVVETATTNAYSIIRVFPDRIEIKGYGREENRVLKIGKKSNIIEKGQQAL